MYYHTGSATETLYQVKPVIYTDDDSGIKAREATSDTKATGDNTATTPAKQTDESRGRTRNGVTKGIDLDTFTLLICDTSDKPPTADTTPKCNNKQLAYWVSVADATGESRNRLKAALINRSDLICSETKAQIVGTNDVLNFTLGSATTILAGAGALVTGITAAKILSGTAALTNSLRSQMNEVFYANALKSAIIQKMDDLRSAQLTVINSRSSVNGKPVEIAKYSTEDMINDVQDYHNDCSFYAGVNGLAQSKTPSAGTQSDSVVPNPPRISSLVPVKSADGTSTNISIRVDVPTDGIAIVDYIGTATNAKATGGDKPLTGKSNGVIPFIEIEKCTAGDDYSVTVVAENKAGPSKPSPALPIKCTVKTTTPPANASLYPPPTGIKVTSKADAIQIGFTPPKSPPTLISSYTATVSSTTPKEVSVKAQAEKTANAFPDVKCVSQHSYAISVVANYGDSKSSAPVKSTQLTRCTE